MGYSKSRSFVRSVKGKVLIAFLAGCVALGLAWAFSKVAFREMMTRVEQLSTPDERQVMVNDVFLNIAQLSQSQRAQALLQRGGSLRAVSAESEPLIAKLDSLRLFYSNSPGQVHRIDSVKHLLQQRDRLFINYLRVRRGLVSGDVLARQMQSLSGLINSTASQIDSTVIATEARVVTREKDTVKPTPVLPPPPDPLYLPEKKNSRLLGRVFGKKEEVADAMSAYERASGDTLLPPQRVIEEVIDIQIDTLALAKQDSLIQAVEELMGDIREDQRNRSALFVNQEMELLNAGNMLVTEMLNILQEMEQEAFEQAAVRNVQARAVIHKSVRHVVITMLVFFLITGVLVYLILTDIARSSTYQEQLETARDEAEFHSQAKQRFLSNMSHELRTPLQSIMGYADLLRQQERPSRENAEAIFRSSEHLLQVVNEVLDYNRIISGKFVFHREPVDLRELLQEVIAAMRSQAEAKSLKLSTHIDLRGTEVIHADPFRLKQILYNLLANAVKFTERGSVRLLVSDEVRGNRTRLTIKVADTGVGISQEDISRIFRQYEQAGTTSGTAGTGLGLHIVNILTGKMGGTIWVNSEPGKGSVFTVSLKFALTEAVGHRERQPKPSLAGNWPKIWVVDDDDLILQWCSAVFKKQGIPHHCFNQPREVLSMPWDEEVKIVLLDIRMPLLDGPELCRHLREKVPADVKIFALTAQVLPDEREKTLQQGFDGMLLKPFREEELLRLISSATQESVARQDDTVQGSPVKDNDSASPDESASPAGAGVGAQTPSETVPTMDLSSLEALTFGDQEQIRKILDQFVTDTDNDIRQIYHSLELSDTEKLMLLLHRMAGRTAQMGARNLAAQFRSTEISLRQHKSLEETHKREINSLMKEMAALVKNIPLS